MAKRYSVEQKNACFMAYMSGLTSKEIAQEYNVNFHTIKAWAKDDKWLAQKNELEDQKAMNFMMKYKNDLMEHRLVVMRRHLGIGEKLEKRIEQILDSSAYISASQILDLSRAMKSAGDVTARAVGMTDKNDPLAFTNESGGKGVLTSGIIINVGGMPSPIKKAQDIVEVKHKAPFA